MTIDQSRLEQGMEWAAYGATSIRRAEDESPGPPEARQRGVPGACQGRCLIPGSTARKTHWRNDLASSAHLNLEGQKEQQHARATR